MIIYGKKGCPACELAREAHPDAEYHDLEADIPVMEKMAAGYMDAMAYSARNGMMLPVFCIAGEWRAMP
jgi:hypothetical protein